MLRIIPSSVLKSSKSVDSTLIQFRQRCLASSMARESRYPRMATQPKLNLTPKVGDVSIGSPRDQTRGPGEQPAHDMTHDESGTVDTNGNMFEQQSSERGPSSKRGLMAQPESWSERAEPAHDKDKSDS